MGFSSRVVSSERDVAAGGGVSTAADPADTVTSGGSDVGSAGIGVSNATEERIGTITNSQRMETGGELVGHTLFGY